MALIHIFGFYAIFLIPAWIYLYLTRNIDTDKITNEQMAIGLICSGYIIVYLLIAMITTVILSFDYLGDL